MKILFLLGSGSTLKFPKITGPESRLKDVFQHLSCHNITIIYSIHGHLNSFFNENKKILRYIPYTNYSFFTLLKFLYKNSKDVDYIHCHGPYIFDFLSSIVGFVRKKNVFISRLVCVSEDYLIWYKRLIFRFLDNINILLNAQYLTISLHHQAVLYNELRIVNYFIPVRIPVIYNGVSKDKFYKTRCYNSSQQAFSIAIVAHLSNLKGHEILFKAISYDKSLRNRISSITVIGDGPLRSYLEIKCRDLKIDSITNFVGLSENVSQYLHKTDIVVLPSFREGFPLSLIEAQMAGCLTIASNVGANHELILDNVSGFLFNVGNYSELSRILSKVTSEWEVSIKIAKYGQANSLKYCSHTMIESYSKLYS
jgi:L-malate glycosyltransferase